MTRRNLARTASLLAASGMAAALTLTTVPAVAAQDSGRAPSSPGVSAGPVGVNGWVKKTIPNELYGIHPTAPGETPGVVYGGVRLWDTGTFWNVLEAQKDVYNWAPLDAQVAAAGDREIILVLGATPAWVSKNPNPDDAKWIGPGSGAVPPKSEWIQYVTDTATRYKGRIDAYQIWNEPTIPVYWRGTMPQLAKLTALAYKAVKKADPNAIVIASPIVPRQPGWEPPARKYLQALKGAGWPVDAFAVHGYPKGATGPDSRVQMIALMRNLLAQYSAPNRPLWETEMNFATGPGGKGLLPLAKQVEYISRNYLDTIRTGLARSYWYAWGPIPDHLRIDIRRPAVAKSYKVTRSWTVGTRFEGCKTSGPSRTLVTTCTFVGAQGTTDVVWSLRPVFVSTKAKTVSNLKGKTTSAGGSLMITPAPQALRY